LRKKKQERVGGGQQIGNIKTKWKIFPLELTSGFVIDLLQVTNA